MLLVYYNASMTSFSVEGGRTLRENWWKLENEKKTKIKHMMMIMITNEKMKLELKKSNAFMSLY